MNLRNRLSLIALAVTLPAPALAQTAQEFQLPPAPSPSASPRVQGPVDEEGPGPVRPQPIRTAVPTPRPAVTIPAPTPTAAPSAEARPQAVRPAVSNATRAPAARNQPAPVTPLEPAPLDIPSATPTPIPTATATALPSPEVTASTVSSGSVADFWPWIGALIAALIAGLGVWFWRRRRNAAPPPVIERPTVQGTSTATPVTSAPVGQPVTLQVEAVKLTRSFAFATLDYRLTLINRTAQAMSDLAISADLYSAHGNAPMEQQVALPSTELPQQHAITRLAPGQSQQLSGQVQLPISQAQVIRQGNLPLFVPLLRLRVDGTGGEPVSRTYVIGQSAAEGSRLQPFRLDEGPRSYQPLGQRELA